MTTRSKLAAGHHAGAASVPGNDGEPVSQAIGPAPLLGQLGQARLDLHPDPAGIRVTREQQERERPAGAAYVEKAAIRRRQETDEQDGVEATAQALPGLQERHPPAQQRIARDLRLAGHGHSGSGSAGRSFCITKPVANLGSK